jgi:UDP-N-acetylglucosamine 2-epimerase
MHFKIGKLNIGNNFPPVIISKLGINYNRKLNNIKIAHIEEGEFFGTVDEIIRHSISKLSHLHFVTNNIAKQRLIQMREVKKIFL